MKTVPSLSEQSWVTDSAKILNHLISYYILTDNAQSLVFQDSLINLPYTYYQHINDPESMATAVKSDLDKLLSRYFSIVDVKVQSRQIEGKKYGIVISAAIVDDDNKRVDLSQVVEINTTGLRNVINVSNYGDGVDLLGQLS